MRATVFIGAPVLQDNTLYADIGVIDYYSRPGKELWSKFGNLKVGRGEDAPHRYLFASVDARMVRILQYIPKPEVCEKPTATWWVAFNDPKKGMYLLEYINYMKGEYDQMLNK